MSTGNTVRRRARIAGGCVAVGLGLACAACHTPPELPPIPPRPIDPEASGAMAYRPLAVIDASIVSDGGESLEAAIGRLDGAVGPAAQPATRLMH
jgi:hypothetical protein